MKVTFFLPVLALAARVALAAMPPACLLHAVNTADDPSDVNAVCGNSATDVQAAIADICSGNVASAAQSAFIATCSSNGKKVAAYTATATGSSHSGTYIYTTAVYNSSCKCTQTIVTSANAATATGLVTSGTGSSRTGSVAGATSSAGAVPGQPKMGGYAAAAIALVGAVAAL